MIPQSDGIEGTPSTLPLPAAIGNRQVLSNKWFEIFVIFLANLWFQILPVPVALEMGIIMSCYLTPHCIIVHFTVPTEVWIIWGQVTVYWCYCRCPFPRNGQKFLRIRLEIIQMHSKSPFPSENLCIRLCIDWHSLPRWLSGKESSCQWLGFHPWFGKIPWRKEWQPTPVLFPGRFHGQRSRVGYSPWGCKELDTTEWLSMRVHIDWHSTSFVVVLVQSLSHVRLWKTQQ